MLGYVTCVLGPMPRSACRDRYHLWWRAWFLLVDELLVVYSGTIVPTTCQTRVYSKRVMTLHLPRMGRIVLLYLVAASLPLALQGAVASALVSPLPPSSFRSPAALLGTIVDNAAGTPADNTVHVANTSMCDRALPRTAVGRSNLR